MHRKKAGIFLAAMLIMTGCQGQAMQEAPTMIHTESSDAEQDTSHTTPESDTDSNHTNPESDDTETAALPRYAYTGANGYLQAICSYLCEQEEPNRDQCIRMAESDGYGSKVVYIPAPVMMKTETASNGHIYVYGTFWDFWYALDDDNLFTLIGSENTGKIELAETGNGYQVIGFDQVGDGSYYAEDWQRICGSDHALYERLFTKEHREDTRDEVRRELILEYVREHHLDIKSYQDYGWEPQLLDPTGSVVQLYWEQDGKNYQKTQDLIDSSYHWASVLGEGSVTTDSHGHEHPRYDTQPRWFINLDTGETLEVRRWDNLLWSAGDYLIYEYDGTVHVAKPNDLYHPVLSYPIAGTYGEVHKITGGYMVADRNRYTITYYNEQFEPFRIVEGFRTLASGFSQPDGRMAVQNMDTGLIGFLDEQGEFAIPCQYYDAGHFSNGFCPVLTGAEITPYTEDGGTVQMFGATGGCWAIIDRNGHYALEPSEAYANADFTGSEKYYWGARCFSAVRSDWTADFLDLSQEGRIVETVWIR